jgi:hypothetical protein
LDLILDLNPGPRLDLGFLLASFLKLFLSSLATFFVNLLLASSVEKQLDLSLNLNLNLAAAKLRGRHRRGRGVERG